MDETRMHEALGFVLHYLSDNELSIAATVCRAWNQMVDDESLSRNLYIDYLKKNYKLHCIFNNTIQINQFKLLPEFQIFFTNDKESPYLNVHLCENMKFNSYTVLMKSNSDEDHIEKANFSASFQFSSYSFAEVIMCTYIYPNFRSNQLRSTRHRISSSDEELEPDFNESGIIISEIYDELSINVLLILCQEREYYNLSSKFKDLIISKNYYRNTIVWGGTVDELSVCRFSLRKHFCKKESKFTFIFMMNPKMRAYLQLFIRCSIDYTNNIYPKLEQFREKVNLSAKSMAFIHVSTFYGEDKVDKVFKAFKEIFPQVTLFGFYGTFSLGGYNHGGYLPNDLCSQYACLASIMILTFD